MGKRGRPRAERARYPSGQVKPQGAGVTGAQLHRLRSLSKYPLLETQIGRLLFLEEITQEQAYVAWKIAEIYGRYDRAMGRRRAAASPAYEAGRGRDTGLEESEMEAHISAVAARKFGNLQAEIRPLSRHPQALRAALEALCIEDRHPGGELAAVKAALDALAFPLGLRGKRK